MPDGTGLSVHTTRCHVLRVLTTLKASCVFLPDFSSAVSFADPAAR
ncbi:hypothetical protein ABT025_26445 [Streptomyces sp. NPDC002809]